MEDWSIDGQEDLFASSNGCDDQMMEPMELFSSTNFLERDIGQAVQVVSCIPSTSGEPEKPEKSVRKKILKRTSRGGNEAKAVSLKKVTFDVEKFAADECGDAEERNEARARLAVRLGARAPKTPFVNYKQLKEELNVKKNSEAEFDKLSALKALKKLSMKKKVKGKKLHRR